MNPCKLAASAVMILGLSVLTVHAQDPRSHRTIPAGVEVVRDVEYGQGGGHPLLLDIYRPQQRSERPIPAVIWIHGGGWRAGDKATASNAPAIADHGYFAVSINYRLSGEAAFPAAIEDCKCAVRWLRANAAKYGVDPDRIGVWGGSAGGHLALLVAAAGADAGLEGKGGNEGVSSRVQAVCSFFGPADFTDATRKQWGQRGAGGVAKFLGGTADEVPELWVLASPATHVSPDDPPTLMVHGEEDPVVPIGQSEYMLAKLQDAKVPAQLIRVKNAGHGFRPMTGVVAPSWDEILASVVKFFDERLKTPAAAETK